MKQDIPENEILQLSVNRISGSESARSYLSKLINSANLSKEILNIQSYESALFNLDKTRIKIIKTPQLDRLTLVYPLSYSFSLIIEVNGYFQVKYKAFQDPLPQQVEPFQLVYSGIIVFQDQGPQFRNEKLELI